MRAEGARMSFVVLALIVGIVPAGGLVYLKWRFAPKRVRERTDRLLDEAEQRMERKSDDELERLVRDDAYLKGAVAGSTAAKRIRALVDKREYARLQKEWPELWPGLLAAENRPPGAAPRGLDSIINIGAAIAVLARRQA